MTGDFWNLENPAKPWGPFDPDDAILIPFDFAEWITGQGTSYVSHSFIEPDGLVMTVHSVTAGVIVVKVEADGVLVSGQKYPIGCQITTADGQRKTKTLYLKIANQ